MLNSSRNATLRGALTHAYEASCLLALAVCVQLGCDVLPLHILDLSLLSFGCYFCDCSKEKLATNFLFRNILARFSLPRL